MEEKPPTKIDENVIDLYGLCRKLDIPIPHTRKIQEFYRKTITDLIQENYISKEEVLETLKLWRPYFYRDKITEEDIAELKKLLK